MGGQLSKASSDVSFVIVKDVLAQKYKVFILLFYFFIFIFSQGICEAYEHSWFLSLEMAFVFEGLLDLFKTEHGEGTQETVISIKS